MKLSLSSLRALAALVTTLLVAGLLSTLTSGTAHADEPTGPKVKARTADTTQTLTVDLVAPEGMTKLTGELDIFVWNTTWEYWDWYGQTRLFEDEPAQSTEFTVQPGMYYASFYSWTNDLETYSYLDGATETPVGPDAAGVVEVAAGGATDASITLRPRATINGTVTGPDGLPLPWGDVEAYAVDANPDDGAPYATYFEEGAFSLPVDAGTWRVVVRGSGDVLDHSYDPVTVTRGVDVTLPPAQLRTPATTSATGSVTFGGAPLADAEVALLHVQGDDDWDWVNSTTTDASGTYTLPGVREGRDYTILVEKDGVVHTYLGNVPDIADATLFTSAQPSVPVIAALPGSTLRGVLRGAGSGTPGYVHVYRFYGEDAHSYSHYRGTLTDDQGNWSVVVPPGNYAVVGEADDSAFRTTAMGATRAAWVEEAGSFPITSGQDVTKDIDLLRNSRLTGTVVHDDTPVAGAAVTAYIWHEQDEYWEWWDNTTTEDDGTYAVFVPTEVSATVRISRGGFRAQFLDGGTSLPETPDSTNSITATEGTTALGTTTLVPRVSSLGKVAGEKLSWCLTHQIEANDDESSNAVDLPFPLRFYGVPYEELYVNNNGNVTFGSSLSDYTPEDLTGPTGIPMIAPFFADVDTRGADSNLVTYGASPDGKQFCVNWADVGHYDERSNLNTFQLILTRNDTGAGRVSGDFDIRFNYDEIVWEAGEASGSDDNGLGGTTAATGFTDGTGEVGTHVQLDGSLEPGTFLDGGPRALVANSQRSTQVGRYNFEVRNDGIEVALGNVEGRVTDGSRGVADATVQACLGSGQCTYTDTDNVGEYRLTALRAGTYNIRVWPTGNLFGGGATTTVTAGETAVVPTIVLTAPAPVPTGTTVNGSTGGVPSLVYTEPTQLVVNGCAGVTSPRVTVTLADGRQIQSVAMTESPAGRYTATIPPLHPHTGDATVTTTVPATCGGSPVSFNIYIDPAGVVTDQWGRLIQGASVLLHRSDTETGTYAVVPNGSDIMSPSNRDNPSTTDEDGYFQWDVTPGWYRVDASANQCGSLSSDTMEVPPERLSLVLKLTCDTTAPSPTTAPAVSGGAEVGSTLTAKAGTWQTPLASTRLEWLRDGVLDPSITGTTYTTKAADLGVTFTVRNTAQSPDRVSDDGSVGNENRVVDFQAVTATSAGVKVVAKPTPKPPVVKPKKVKATVKVTAPKKTKASKRAKVTVRVKATGKRPRPVASGRLVIKLTAKGKVKGKKVRTLRVKLKKGKAVFKLPKLPKGKWTVRVTYQGNAKILKAVSKKRQVRVTK